MPKDILRTSLFVKKHCIYYEIVYAERVLVYYQNSTYIEVLCQMLFCRLGRANRHYNINWRHD